jgi:hypothetical protein
MAQPGGGNGNAWIDGASLYVNYFEIAHNRYEFLIELGQYRPGADGGPGSLAIHTRLALSPPYAKMLSDLLSRAVAEHEASHGPIASIAETSTPFDIVLHSLPEFEDRARQARAKARQKAAKQTSSSPLHSKTGDAT